MLADAASSSWLCLPGSMCPGWMFPNDRVRGSRASTGIGSSLGQRRDEVRVPAVGGPRDRRRERRPSSRVRAPVRERVRLAEGDQRVVAGTQQDRGLRREQDDLTLDDVQALLVRVDVPVEPAARLHLPDPEPRVDGAGALVHDGPSTEALGVTLERGGHAPGRVGRGSNQWRDALISPSWRSRARRSTPPTGSRGPRARRRRAAGCAGVVIRTIGPSRSKKRSSATIEATSAPQPHSRGLSSTVTNRPVLPTDSRIVVASSGTSDRTSITSASMPSPASPSAASNALGHHRAERRDRDVGSPPQHVGRAEPVDDLAVGDLALARVQHLRLDDDDRVGIADGGREQPDHVHRGSTARPPSAPGSPSPTPRRSASAARRSGRRPRSRCG